jgi:FKBP-type peptidyl-prolyl cis-trans isomerase FklB
MRLPALLVTLLLTAGVTTAQETPAAKTAQPTAQEASTATSRPTAAPPKAEEKAQEGAADKDPQAQTGAIHNAREKLSYALGVDLAFRLKWQRVDVDPELVIKGLQDVFANDGTELLIPGKEAALTVKQFQAQRQRGLEHAMGMLSEKNKKAGAEFSVQNAKKDGVQTLPSGLQYKIVKEGDGRKPTLDDSVQCHYRGTLLDGAEFDSSYKSSDAPTFPLNRSIKGWQEALQLMPVGSKWEIAVPPQLAYGERGGGMIGPNATLIFEMELISIPEAGQSAGTPQKPSSKTEGGQ